MSETERKILHYRGAAKGGCPSCGKPANAHYRPFCSKRCADLDLHRWLAEGYRIPTEEAPPDESPAEPPESEDR